MARIQTYSEFWKFYLGEHSKKATRALHALGTSLGILIFGVGASLGRWEFAGYALVVAYGFAWTSHFFVEHNRPATFKYPLWSFISDFRMMFWMATGRL